MKIKIKNIMAKFISNTIIKRFIEISFVSFMIGSGSGDIHKGLNEVILFDRYRKDGKK